MELSLTHLFLLSSASSVGSTFRINLELPPVAPWSVSGLDYCPHHPYLAWIIAIAY